MRLVILFLLGSLSTSAQIITDMHAVVGTNCFTFRYNKAGGGIQTSSFAGGIAPGSLLDTIPSMSADDGDYSIPWCRPDANTDYYIQPTIGAFSFTCPVVCSNCTSADDPVFSATPSNLNCGNIGEPPFVHTNTTPVDTDPVAPTHVTITPYAEITGTVTHTNCASFLADFNAVKAVGSPQILAVDNSAICSINQTALTGATNRVTIQPDIAPEQFVTEYSQISADEPNVLHFRVADAPRLERVQSGIGLFTGLSNVTFRQTKFDFDPKPYAPTQLAVSSVNTGTGQVTLATACPTGLALNTQVWLNLPGLSAYPANSTVTSCAAGVLTLSGTYTGVYSGGGTVTWGSNIPVSGATNGASTQLTVPNHGLPTGGGGQSYIFVWVAGDLANEINGTHAFTVVDANTIELTGIASTEPYVASNYDYVFFNSGLRFQIIEATNSVNFRCLQCIIGTPWFGQFRSGALLGLVNANGAIIRDSVLYGAFPGAIVNPSTGLPNALATTAAFTGRVAVMANINDVQIINNAIIDCSGICFDAQDTGPVTNLTFSQNHFYTSNRLFPDVLADSFSGSLGRWSQTRHLIEFKAAVTNGLLTGNWFSGHAFDAAAPQGYAIWVNDFNSFHLAFEPALSSLEISWNFFERVGECLGLGAGDPSVDENTTFATRLKFSDNICVQNWQDQRVAPGSTGSTAKASGISRGQMISITEGGEFVKFLRNTFWSSQGTGAGTAVLYQRLWAPSCEIENNSFPYHISATGGFSGIGVAGPAFSPVDTTNFQTIFDSGCPNGSFQNNLIICGVRNASNVAGLKNSSNPAEYVDDAACSVAWPTSGSFTGLTTVNGNSYAARHSIVYPSGSYFPVAPYTGYGVTDETMMLNKLGTTRDLVVNQIPATTNVKFEWTAPNTSGCTVRLSSDGGASIIKQTAVSGSNSQTVTFTGLLASTYKGYVECPNGKPLTWQDTVN